MNWADWLIGAAIALLGLLVVVLVLSVEDEPDDWEDEHERWCDCLCPRCEPALTDGND
jgi:hypothetical protein